MPCCSIGDIVLRILRTAFVGTYCFVVVLFLACGVALVWLAGQVLWHGVMDVGTAQSARFDAILRTIGHLTIGVAALELGQTVLEEEVLRSTHVSGPTRARRFLSRFLVVVVVALAVESLIAVFHAASDTPEYLPHAASIALGAAVLLAAWGLRAPQSRCRGDGAGVDGGSQAGGRGGAAEGIRGRDSRRRIGRRPGAPTSTEESGVMRRTRACCVRAHEARS